MDRRLQIWLILWCSDYGREAAPASSLSPLRCTPRCAYYLATMAFPRQAAERERAFSEMFHFAGALPTIAISNLRFTRNNPSSRFPTKVSRLSR
jgi:hypothetical protein